VIVKFIFIMSFLLSASSLLAEDGKKSKLRYSKGKAIDFESLLIEGQIKRPDISVVTGNMGDDMNGLLRLREDFIDEMAMDIGEELK
jgi:hypothetical protein